MNYVRRESFRERLLYRSSAVLNARTLHVYIGEVPNKLGAEHATFLSLQFFVSAGLLSTIFIYTYESDRGATKCFVVYRFEKVDCLRQKCRVEGGRERFGESPINHFYHSLFLYLHCSLHRRIAIMHTRISIPTTIYVHPRNVPLIRSTLNLR